MHTPPCAARLHRLRQFPAQGLAKNASHRRQGSCRNRLGRNLGPSPLGAESSGPAGSHPCRCDFYSRSTATNLSEDVIRNDCDCIGDQRADTRLRRAAPGHDRAASPQAPLAPANALSSRADGAAVGPDRTAGARRRRGARRPRLGDGPAGRRLDRLRNRRARTSSARLPPDTTID